MGSSCSGQDGFYHAGCHTEARFVDNGDGTVIDHCTGLMWQKDTADVNGNGVLDGSDKLVRCDALAYCENLVGYIWDKSYTSYVRAVRSGP